MSYVSPNPLEANSSELVIIARNRMKESYHKLAYACFVWKQPYDPLKKKIAARFERCSDDPREAVQIAVFVEQSKVVEELIPMAASPINLCHASIYITTLAVARVRYAQQRLNNLKPPTKL
jgi:hypothetical protein